MLILKNKAIASILSASKQVNEQQARCKATQRLKTEETVVYIWVTTRTLQNAKLKKWPNPLALD